MKCEKCGGKLSVTNTYAAGCAKTQRATCGPCKKEYCVTSVSVIHEADFGTGAYATAQKILKGKLKVKLDGLDASAASEGSASPA